MSDFNVIDIKFKVTQEGIDDARSQLQTGLDHDPVEIGKISVSNAAVDGIRNQIEEVLEDKEVVLMNIDTTKEAVDGLRSSISDKLAEKEITIKGLKAGSINLKDAEITGDKGLRDKISDAINKGEYSLKISNVDATDAIKQVQNQLQKALNEAGFFGVKSNGKDGNKQTIVSADEIKRQERRTSLGNISDSFKKYSRTIASDSGLNKSTLISDQIDKINNAIRKVSSGIETMSITSDTAFNTMLSDIQKNIEYLERLVKASNNPVLQNLTKVARQGNNAISGRGNSITDTRSLSLLKSAYEDVEQKIKTATNAAMQFGEPATTDRILPSLEKVVTEYNKAVSLLRELKGINVAPIFNESAATPIGKLNVDGLEEQVRLGREAQQAAIDLQKVWKNATKGDNYNKNIHDSEVFGEMERDYNEVISLVRQFQTASDPEKQREYTTTIKERTEALIRLIHAEQDAIAASNKVAATERNQQVKKEIKVPYKSAANLAKQMQGFLNSNSGLSRDSRTSDMYETSRNDLGTLYTAMRNGTKGKADILGKDLDAINNRFKALEVSAKKFGLSGQTAFERISKAYSKFGGWMLVTSSLMEGITLLHQTVTNVEQLDRAMTELKKVTNETGNTYSEFLDNAAERSRAVGSSLTDMVTATADFSRLGYNMEDAQGLAETALIYSNVGDGIDSINEASQSIVSTMKAFYDTADSGLSKTEQATHIIDAFNEVGKDCCRAA